MKTINLLLLINSFSQKFLIFVLFLIIFLFSFNCILAQTTMQSWRWSDCRDLATPTGTNFTQGPTLTDERDGKQYEIRKFSDGQGWMVDNLMYGGTTDACAGKSTFNGNGSATSSNQFGTGTFGDCRDPRVGGSAPCTAGSTTCGYYYNWQAAMQHASAYYNTTYTGFTTNVQGLCPEGWSLPTNAGDYSFAVLHEIAGLPATGFWQGSNWKGPFSGGCGPTGTLYYQGGRGYWWSSSLYNVTNAYGMYFHSTYVNPSDYGNYKNYGFTIRCLKNYEGEDPKANGEYTYVEFLRNGVFTPPADINSVDVLIVAGGGGGAGTGQYGTVGAGGGGAGGLNYLTNIFLSQGNSFQILVGDGGLGGPNTGSTPDSGNGQNGGDSAFGEYIVKGGGGGGTHLQQGKDGGSGGGGGGRQETLGGSSLDVSQGNDGGKARAGTTAGSGAGGGGGGASEAGGDGGPDSNIGGNGGDGVNFANIFGENYGDSGWFAGGGAGAGDGTDASSGNPGLGGGGIANSTTGDGGNGSPYTGGGGGGTRTGGKGGDGGSGIVIVRYKTIEAAWSENYYLQFGEFIFGETATASAIRLNIDQMEIDFGSLTPDVFVQKSNQLTVNSNIPIGYSLYIQQNDWLKVSNYRFLADDQKARGTINNTSCDQQNCDFNQASAWTNPKNSGLGYTASGSDTLVDFNNGQLYRPLPAVTLNEEAALVAQDRQATDLLRDRHTQVQYQLAISGATLAGTYNNAIMYTLVPNF